jgi:hypothetical protein
MATPVSSSAASAIPGVEDRRKAGLAHLLFYPSLADILLIVLEAILFMSGVGWAALLSDGDTGWHIRTGEHILQTHAVPERDLFSAIGRDAPWYAWEWLADVIFALLHNWAGLKGVVLLSGLFGAATVMVLFRHMLWKGAELHVSVLVAILAADALSFHFLARPHMFTTLLVAVTLWMLDWDASRHSRLIWLLVPITVIWTNLHGGFLVLLAAIGAYGAGAILRSDKAGALRYAVLGLACAAATLLNPYGWKLHYHMWHYLRAEWLVERISEFQSPTFRGGQSIRFEVLLFLGLVIALELLRKRRYQDVLLLLVWAHAALVSARHITIYVIAAAPLIAEQASRLWIFWAGDRARDSVPGIVRELSRDMRPLAMRFSLWTPAFIAFVALGPVSGAWPSDFPKTFPGPLVSRNIRLLAAPGQTGPILSSDLWSGYLEYRLYPQRRTFIDGRSDFFGPAILDEYICIRAACDKSDALLARYAFRFALIPPDWPLASAMKRSSNWALKDRDETALLFERRGL